MLSVEVDKLMKEIIPQSAGGRKMQQEIAKMSQTQAGTQVCVKDKFYVGQGQFWHENQLLWARPP